MYTTVSEHQVDIFQEPARLIFAGCSGSGKSYLLSKLVQKYSHKFDRIILVGANLENLDGINIVRDDTFDPFSDDALAPFSKHSLVLYDDVMLDKRHLFNCNKLFTQGRHGIGKTESFSTAVLVQNVYHNDKNYRNLSLNATHVFLFKNRDLRQIQIFGASFLMKNSVSNFIDLYNTVLAKRYSYLLVDFTKHISDVLALRGSVAGESREIAYKL